MFSSIAAEKDAHTGKACGFGEKKARQRGDKPDLRLATGRGGLLAGFDVNAGPDRMLACGAQTADEGAAMPHKRKGEARGTRNANPDPERSGQWRTGRGTGQLIHEQLAVLEKAIFERLGR
ncbi:hypothetical protein [Burkholderia ubonensis]|uniref:hypothetical protein n=1 Tax=Burkholderia ubonensis TaxID=101571 RepID=UPI000B154ADF|nr:hypothetical protein [Burkholderia ubonensis]